MLKILKNVYDSLACYPAPFGRLSLLTLTISVPLNTQGIAFTYITH